MVCRGAVLFVFALTEVQASVLARKSYIVEINNSNAFVQHILYKLVALFNYEKNIKLNDCLEECCAGKDHADLNIWEFIVLRIFHFSWVYEKSQTVRIHWNIIQTFRVLALLQLIMRCRKLAVCSLWSNLTSRTEVFANLTTRSTDHDKLDVNPNQRDSGFGTTEYSF